MDTTDPKAETRAYYGESHTDRTLHANTGASSDAPTLKQSSAAGAAGGATPDPNKAGYRWRKFHYMYVQFMRSTCTKCRMKEQYQTPKNCLLLLGSYVT